MALDGLVIHSIVDELHKKLLGGKIDKVYQPENHEVVLHADIEQAVTQIISAFTYKK